jgi:hypothetical protein
MAKYEAIQQMVKRETIAAIRKLAAKEYTPAPSSPGIRPDSIRDRAVKAIRNGKIGASGN